MVYKEGHGQGISVLLVLAFFFHAIDVFFIGFEVSPTRITARVIMYAFLAFFVFRKQSAVGRMQNGKSIMAFILTFLTPILILPLIRDYVLKSYLTADLFTWVNIFILLIPIWVIYIMNTLGDIDPDSNIRKMAVWYFMILGIIGVIYAAIYTSDTIAGIDQFQTTRLNPLDAWQGFVAVVIDVGQQVRVGVNETISPKIEGSFLQPQVEDGVNKYGPEIKTFDSIITNKKQYYSNEPLEFTGSIITRNLKSDVTVDLTCFAEDQLGIWRINKDGEYFNRGILGKTISQSSKSDQFIIEGLGIETNDFFSCYFESLPPGRYNIVVQARFSYNQTGYVRYSFITKEDLIAVQREGTNPYNKYGLTRIPESKFTNGPIDISLSPGQQTLPVPVSDEIPINVINANTFNIGFQLRNNKNKGIITRINKFEYNLPEEMNLECSNNFVSTGIRDLENGYRSYTAQTKNQEDNIDTTYTQACVGNIPPTKVPSLFGGDMSEPVELLMGITVDYDYLAYRKIGGISVLEREALIK